MAKLQDVANYLLYLDKNHDGEGISNMKLQKLVYYSQGFFSAIYGKPLFDDAISAWVHGPVVTSLYHSYKKYGSGHIPAPEESTALNLTSDECGLIQEVFEEFGQYSAWKLRNMTHEEPPWINHESDVSVIPIDEITEYFKTRIN